MPRLFDASSVAATVLERDDIGFEVLFDEHVLDLTFYEVGNVFWKASALQERLTHEEASKLVSFLMDLKAEMVVERAEGLDFDRTMKIATTEDLTFYDAAYVVAAEELGATLITEDAALASAASSYVKANGLDEIA